MKLCAIVGKPDKESGEIPVAYIVLNDETITKEELINFVKKRVAPYKKIRDVIFMEELPLTPVGKVLKRTLRKKLIKEEETTKNS